MNSLSQNSVATCSALLATYQLVSCLPVLVSLRLSSLAHAKLCILSVLPSSEHRRFIMRCILPTSQYYDSFEKVGALPLVHPVIRHVTLGHVPGIHTLIGVDQRWLTACVRSSWHIHLAMEMIYDLANQRTLKNPATQLRNMTLPMAIFQMQTLVWYSHHCVEVSSVSFKYLTLHSFTILGYYSVYFA